MKKLLSCIISVLLLLPALVWPVVAEENAASQETSAAEESASAGKTAPAEDRMTEALNTCADGNPYEILQGVRKAVDAFVGDAEQFDDLTMMCLEYKGPQNTAH